MAQQPEMTHWAWRATGSELIVSKFILKKNIVKAALFTGKYVAEQYAVRTECRNAFTKLCCCLKNYTAVSRNGLISLLKQ